MKTNVEIHAEADAILRRHGDGLPWERGRGRDTWMAAIYGISEALREVERLRAALEDVVNPVENLRRSAEAEGSRLNGMAYSIANDLGFVQNIAREALTKSG